MMASFTHCYKKDNWLRSFIMLGLTAAIMIYSHTLFAVTTTTPTVSALIIKQAELLAKDEAYKLQADFDVAFSPEIEDAINKGVPLTFLIEFQVVSPRHYWFDDEIVTLSMKVVLSYHALSRQFLINRDNHQLTFATLSEAKNELGKLRDWVVLEKAMLKKGETYNAALRVRLDQSQLPKPLQVEAINSGNWAMVSEPYRWTPVFNF
jgi:uncharacterized membrane protein SirB2